MRGGQGDKTMIPTNIVSRFQMLQGSRPQPAMVDVATEDGTVEGDDDSVHIDGMPRKLDEEVRGGVLTAHGA